jgi:hypothetical protein
MTIENIEKLSKVDLLSLNTQDKVYVFIYGYGDMTKHYGIEKDIELLYKDFKDMCIGAEIVPNRLEFITEAKKYFPIKATRAFKERKP